MRPENGEVMNSFSSRGNSRPKVIVFDLGKVFLEFDYMKGAVGIARSAKLPPEDIIRVISGHPALIAYETGRISTDEFFRVMCDVTGFQGSPEEFFEHFTNVFIPVEEMIDFNEQLRAKGYRTYILSNTNQVTVEHIRRSYPFFSHFDGYVFSYECGVMKPDPAIYQAMERLAGVSGEEIFYVDDLPSNVEGARKLGWQAYVHESPTRTIQIAKMLGII